MPASRDINRYTDKWMHLFNFFQDHPEVEHVIECKSVREAHIVRLEFYRAREALRRKEDVDKKEDPAAYKEYGHPNLDRKEVRIVGTNVIFGYKESSRIAELIASSLPPEYNLGAPE